MDILDMIKHNATMPCRWCNGTGKQDWDKENTVMKGLKMADAYYPTPTNEVGQLRRATITERLTREKSELENRLKQINDCLSVMQSNPEIANTLDAISKLYL